MCWGGGGGKGGGGPGICSKETQSSIGVSQILGGLNNKGNSILVSVLRSPYFGKLPFEDT